MASNIDPTKPLSGVSKALTSDVRSNFQAAKNEIEALQLFDSLLDTAVRADLASTTVDDGTKGFHLVFFPPLAGETNIINYEYRQGDIQRTGAKLDGTTDDFAAVQATVTWCSTNKRPVYARRGTGNCIISAPIVVPGYLNLIGEAAPFKTDQSYFQFTSTTDNESLFACANNSFVNIRNVGMKTTSTAQINAVSIGVLGTLSSQASAQLATNFHQVYFEGFYGTALKLGGEVFGTLSSCVFWRVAQALAINWGGELNIRSCHFETMYNASFLPETGNKDAYIYIKDTVVKVTESVLQHSEQYRHWVFVEGESSLYVSGIKVEVPGVTTMTKDVFRIDHTATPTATMKNLSIKDSDLVASSLTSDGGGRLITLVDPSTTAPAIQNSNFSNLSFSMAGTTPASVPCIDATGCGVFRWLHLGKIWKTPATVAVLAVSDGTQNLTSGQVMGGITSDHIIPITVNHTAKLLASQENTSFPVMARDNVVYHNPGMNQIIPISMGVEASTTLDATNPVQFRYSLDVGDTGSHDGAANAATLTDSAATWTTDQFVGFIIKNTTDGSQGIVTANTATTITATLAGGTDNDWDVSDVYTIALDQAVIPAGISGPEQEIRFPLRKQYQNAMSLGAFRSQIKYTSQSTLVTTVDVSVRFTYAFVSISTTAAGKALIDVK